MIEFTIILSVSAAISLCIWKIVHVTRHAEREARARIEVLQERLRQLDRQHALIQFPETADVVIERINRHLHHYKSGKRQ